MAGILQRLSHLILKKGLNNLKMPTFLIMEASCPFISTSKLSYRRTCTRQCSSDTCRLICMGKVPILRILTLKSGRFLSVLM